MATIPRIKMNAQIVPAEAWHIDFIAPNVREADRNELYAIACYSPESALVASLAVSRMAWTGLIDDVPVCCFGVTGASTLSDKGLPWMIATWQLDKHALVFLRRCRKVVGKMLDLYPRLENYVDARNTRAIQWLRWLGFEFDDPQPYGVLKLPFLRFHMER